MKQENTWGGARPGSGRKPIPQEEKRVQMVVTIEKETRDKLRARAKAEHVRVGRLIDEWMGES